MSEPESGPRPRRIGRFGWVPDLPDARDYLFSAPSIALARLPSRLDLRDLCPEIYDQGRIGSCTANAIAGAFEFDLMKQALPDFMPSRLFIYYNERAMEGRVPFDAGAQLRDGIKSVARLGACSEDLWPYDDTPARFDGGPFPPESRAAKRPPNECYKEARQHRATSYQRVLRSLDQLRGCLAAGYPFVFGFTVFESFEDEKVAETGVIPMPAPGEDILGGHAVLAVGYDDSSARFIVRNSWGTDWGDDGYFTMPYPYLQSRGLSSDFWMITSVT